MGTAIDHRAEVVEALEVFQAANVELRRQLRKTEVWVGRSLRQIRRDERVIEVMEREDLRHVRAELADEMARFEAAKRQLRVVTFRLAMTENATVADLARVWGFSRQLASRFAKEAAVAKSARQASRHAASTARARPKRRRSATAKARAS